MALTGKQREFVHQYLSNGYNATKAYYEAYDTDMVNANKNGSSLLKNPAVKAEIKRLQADRYEAMDITAEHIAQELADMAFAQKGDKEYSANVKLKALDLLQKQLGLQRQKVEADVNTEININIEE